MTIAYDNFKLTSPLGSLFRYYTSDGKYFREALNEKAMWTQENRIKRISKTVYDLAHRTAVKMPAFCTTCMSYACVCDA